MESINATCRREGYPIEVHHSPVLGNHAVASRDIPQGEGLLRAIPYAAEVFDSYKKRMCQVCLLYHPRGAFPFRCQECDQVYFCSEACKDVAMGLGHHPKVCRTMRKLATWNSDRHSKSLIKLLIQILLNHWKERQGILTAYKSRKLLQEQEEERERGVEGEGAIKGEEAGEEDVKDLVTDKELAMELERKLNLQGADELGAFMATDILDREVAFEEEKVDEIQEPVENKFYDVLRLQSHFEDWDEEDDKDWNKQCQNAMALLELAGLTEIATVEGGPVRPIAHQDVKRMISALESNAFGMYDRSKKKPVCFGRAIYPIASFFNHACDCNATAVQADGSMDELTGKDVLGCLDAEETVKQGESKIPGTPPPPPLPPPPTAHSAETEEGSIDPPSSATASEGEDEVKVEAQDEDPYYSRVGAFRMMTFFAIRDITKGQDVTISYIDDEMPLQARRLALLSDYHFHCCCERCVREEKLAGPAPKKGAVKQAGRKKKKGAR